MKTFLRFRFIFVIFLILGSTISAFGQNNTNYLLDSTTSSVGMSGTPGGSSDLGKSKYFYDNHNRLIKIRSWTTGASEIPNYTNYYYSNDKLTEIEITYNDVVSLKTEISYNNQGMTADSVIQTAYNNLPLKNNAKFSYDYNTSGKVSVSTKFQWLSESWNPSTRDSYTYDTEGRITETIKEISYESGLFPVTKIVNTYDANSNVILEQVYNFNSGEWLLNQTIINKYASNLLILREYYSGTNINKADSLFYANGLIENEKQYSISGGSYNLMTSLKYYYNNYKQLSLVERVESTLEGPLTYRTYYFYILAPVSVEDSQKSDFQISPNPASDKIKISFNPSEGSEILIYNSLGEKVFSVGTENILPTNINISDLPKGMYFVRIGDNAAKFVKM